MLCLYRDDIRNISLTGEILFLIEEGGVQTNLLLIIRKFLSEYGYIKVQ